MEGILKRTGNPDDGILLKDIYMRYRKEREMIEQENTVLSLAKTKLELSDLIVRVFPGVVKKKGRVDAADGSGKKNDIAIYGIAWRE